MANTKDAVRDLGWDPNYGEIIAPPPTEDNLTIEIPPGTYKYKHEESAVTETGLKNYEIRGAGPGKTILKAAPNAGKDVSVNGNDSIFYNLNGEAIEVGGFTDDSTLDHGRAGTNFRMEVTDGGIFDVHFKGYTPPGEVADWGGKEHPDDAVQLHQRRTNVNARKSDSEAHVERVRYDGPSHMDGHGGKPGMSIVTPTNEGTLYVRDVYGRNVNGDGSFYSSHWGKLVVERCRFVNSSMANFRLGGNSELRNCVFVHDPSLLHPKNTGEVAGTMGMYLATQMLEDPSGEAKPVPGEKGPYVENVDIIVREGSGSTPMEIGPAIRINEGVGGGHLKDVRIEYDASNGYVIKIHEERARFGKYWPKDHDIALSNVSIVGDGEVDSVIEADGPKRTLDLSACIDMPNAGTYLRGSSTFDGTPEEGSCETATHRAVAQIPWATLSAPDDGSGGGKSDGSGGAKNDQSGGGKNGGSGGGKNGN